MSAIKPRITTMFISLIIIGLLIIAPVYGNFEKEDLVGAWTFDGNAEDASGNGKTGLVKGGANWVDGKFGKALEFNGKDAWVEVPELGTFDEVTIAEWGNVTGRVAGWRVIFNNNGWKQGDVHHQLHPNNKVEFSIHSNPGGNDQFGTFLFDKADLGWVHVATVYSAKEKKIRFFINGKLDAESNWGGNPAVLGPGRIGSWDGGGREWQGMFDDFVILKVALNEVDINNLMNEGVLAVIASVEPAGKITTAWGSIKVQY